MIKREATTSRAHQRGVIAIIVALSMLALVGAVGIALDSGRLFVTKTELQNSADACALSAARELTAPPLNLVVFTRAENAGITVGELHNRDFQNNAADLVVDQSVTFSDTLNGIYAVKGAAPANSKYVRCTVERTGIVAWFMQVLGAGTQTVASTAVATLAPSQTNCAIPLGLCTCPGQPAPNFGLVPGTWYETKFTTATAATSACVPANPTGNFNWIDFSPNDPTPGCGAGGGASELACVMTGPGQCNLPPVGPATCPANGTQPPGCVGATGATNSLADAFNSRFGLYRGGTVTTADLSSKPPDFSGYGYDPGNWAAPAPQNTYEGASGGTPNFRAARAGHLPNQDNLKGGGFRAATAAQLQSAGADRRVVVVPIVDCSGWNAAQHVPILGYACVLLLNPFSAPNDPVRIEYLGSANTPGSPCATSGSVGGPASIGPLVPGLVQ